MVPLLRRRPLRWAAREGDEIGRRAVLCACHPGPCVRATTRLCACHPLVCVPLQHQSAPRPKPTPEALLLEPGRGALDGESDRAPLLFCEPTHNSRFPPPRPCHAETTERHAIFFFHEQVSIHDASVLRMEYAPWRLLAQQMEAARFERPRLQQADLGSGFFVFLIAVPLCLGIAIGSGFPPVAGLITAGVGGVLCSHFGSAPMTIKGPAAGLISVSLAAMDVLGGYRQVLAAGWFAAILQTVFALVGAGRLASVVPPSCTEGMLAAIGVTIVAKQLPVGFGVTDAKGPPLQLLARTPQYFAAALSDAPSVLLIFCTSLLVLVALPMLPCDTLRRLPAGLVVVATAVPLSFILGLPDGQRVMLPGSLLDAVTTPALQQSSVGTFRYAVAFALVGTIESLLTVRAIDNLKAATAAAVAPAAEAPARSDLNRDLLVTGVGNLVCATLGGLPMISEVVRSKANVDAGATSAWSNFVHGALVLCSAALAPSLLHAIPTASLSAMLVVVGARLANPLQLRRLYALGADQLVYFLTTLSVTLSSDLLSGVGAGLAVKLAVHAVRTRSCAALMRSPVVASRFPKSYGLAAGVLRLEGPVVFTNVLHVLRELQARHDGGDGCTTIDLSAATIVDHTALGALREASGESLTLEGLDALRPVADNPHACRIRASTDGAPGSTV